MANRNKKAWIIASVVICGAVYLGLYGRYGEQWRATPSHAATARQNAADPVDLAYRAADLPTLIAGMEKQGDQSYAGTPDWQSNRDMLGSEAPRERGRLHLLDYKQFEDEYDGTYGRGAILFRLDTPGAHPVQVIGVQTLRYDAASKRVAAHGKPLLALVSPADGKLDYQQLELGGDIFLFRFGKTGRTRQGYQRTDAGLIGLALSTNRLLLPLHYIAALTPPNGRCDSTQPVPCRKIVTTFSGAKVDGNAATSGFSSVTLHSTLQTGHGEQSRSDRLEFDQARMQFQRFGDRGIETIEALSPAKTDAFLATLQPAT